MTSSNQFVVGLIRGGARGYAAHAVDRLLESREDLGGDFGPETRRTWLDHLLVRLEELATAVEMDDPRLLAGQLRWTREVPAEDVRDGLQALRAALEEDLPPSAREPVLRIIDEAAASVDEDAALPVRLDAGDPHQRLALQYLEAVWAGDRRNAVRLLSEAVSSGRVSLADIYEKVLLAAQNEIGTMWHLGELTVPEEHVATETTRTAMAVLVHATDVPSPPKGTVLAAAVQGDRHDIGVRAVADMLEVSGRRAISLGADVPVTDLAQAVRDFEPDVLVLAASLSVHLRRVRESIEAVRAVQDAASLPILVGGPGFAGQAGLASKIGADEFAASPTRAVEIVDRLLGPRGDEDRQDDRGVA